MTSCNEKAVTGAVTKSESEVNDSSFCCEQTVRCQSGTESGYVLRACEEQHKDLSDFHTAAFRSRVKGQDDRLSGALSNSPDTPTPTPFLRCEPSDQAPPFGPPLLPWDPPTLFILFQWKHEISPMRSIAILKIPRQLPLWSPGPPDPLT